MVDVDKVQGSDVNHRKPGNGKVEEGLRGISDVQTLSLNLPCLHLNFMMT